MEDIEVDVPDLQVLKTVRWEEDKDQGVQSNDG